jgi:hypothetical protein
MESEFRAGDVVYVSWANVQWETQDSCVTRGIVETTGGGSIVYRCQDGRVSVTSEHAGDRAHRTESEAWAANAQYFRNRAASILRSAEQCEAKAAVLVVA